MTDLTAEQWMERVHPTEPPLPDPDQGRDHRQTELTELAGYWESDDLGRTGRRRPPAYRRAEALATHGAEIAEREAVRAGRIEAAPCTHCAAGIALHPGHLCHPCYQYRTRAGRLPPAEVIARRLARVHKWQG
ncbi:MAG: hypothetical protein M3Y91_14915 [Actinomycetota bacterium]|nr:hypothetical protein [Actinomycetota bacterium]